MRFNSALLVISMVSISGNASSPVSPIEFKRADSIEDAQESIAGTVNAAALQVRKFIHQMDDGVIGQDYFDEMVTKNPFLAAGLVILGRSSRPPSPTRRTDILTIQVERLYQLIDLASVSELEGMSPDDLYRFFIKANLRARERKDEYLMTSTSEPSVESSI